jgi:GNAT superfamily N-acetyltransferase
MSEPNPFPLSDLPPDVRFERLHVWNDADVAFAYEVKRAAMEPHVAARWGVWDDQFQWPFHLKRFAERCFFRITFECRAVGTVALTQAGDHVRFDEFYLLPEVHRHGLGTKVLQHILALTDKAGVPVGLQHLKWNPVGSLYQRHGFLPVGQTAIHFVLERPARERQPSRPVG